MLKCSIYPQKSQNLRLAAECNKLLICCLEARIAHGDLNSDATTSQRKTPLASVWWDFSFSRRSKISSLLWTSGFAYMHYRPSLCFLVLWIWTLMIPFHQQLQACDDTFLRVACFFRHSCFISWSMFSSRVECFVMHCHVEVSELSPFHHSTGQLLKEAFIVRLNLRVVLLCILYCR